MVQHIFSKTFTTLLLTFAYVLLLVHNVVPHHHHDEAANHQHQHLADQHHPHEHAHESHQENPGADHPEKPVADPDHLLSNHQHPFADNTTFHTQENSQTSFSKRQVIPILICFVNFQYSLFHLPDKEPPAQSYSFPTITTYGQAHALRGPPVS